MWSLVVFVADLSGLYHGLRVTAVRLADIGCLQFYNLLAAFTYSVALILFGFLGFTDKPVVSQHPPKILGFCALGYRFGFLCGLWLWFSGVYL